MNTQVHEAYTHNFISINFLRNSTILAGEFALSPRARRKAEKVKKNRQPSIFNQTKKINTASLKL